MSILAGILGLGSAVVGVAGNAVSGLFGFKNKQADLVKESLSVISSVNSSDDARASAIAKIIHAESKSASWLTRMWRPLFMTILMGIVISFWFGYVPPNLDAEMSPMMLEVFSILKVGIMGYIPARTIDKIFDKINIARILNTVIEKKIL